MATISFTRKSQVALTNEARLLDLQVSDLTIMRVCSLLKTAFLQDNMFAITLHACHAHERNCRGCGKGSTGCAHLQSR